MNIGGSLELSMKNPITPVQPEINPEFLDKPAGSGLLKTQSQK